jgi:hypothetical protein
MHRTHELSSIHVRRAATWPFLVCGSAVAAACSAGPISVGDNHVQVLADDSGSEIGAGEDGAPIDASSDASLGPDLGIDSEADGPPAGQGDASDAGPLASRLISLLNSDACRDPLSNGYFRGYEGGPMDISVCKLPTAVYWRAGMQIACDGQRTQWCGPDTDPNYTPSTVGKDSTGASFDAARVRYVDVPDHRSTIFSYRSADVRMPGDLSGSAGSVVAIIYGDRLSYGVVGDEGGGEVIGEASYAAAVSLGIPPDPATGGVNNGVSYIAFTYPRVVDPPEDGAVAEAVGKMAVDELLRAAGK